MFKRVCLICGTNHTARTQAAADEKARKCGGGKHPQYRYGGYESLSTDCGVFCTLVSRHTKLVNSQHIAGFYANVQGKATKWYSQKEIVQIVRAATKSR